MKALIVDPALHSMGGHHYNAVRRLQGELAKLGVDAPCLGSAQATRNVARELSCTPCFTTSVYGRDYSTPRAFARSVAQTSRQLSQALRQDAWPELLVFPCCDQVLAAAAAHVLGRRWLMPMPHILMWLLYGPHHQKATDDPAAAALHGECRSAFAALRATAGDRRRLAAYCETDAMAEFYRTLLPFDVGVTPGPGLITSARTVRAARAGRPPIVASIGFANRSKGYRLLPDAIGKVLLRHDGVRFMIHGIVTGSDAEDEGAVFDRLARLGERVVVSQRVLTEQEYLAWLSQADLVLLPYDPNAYSSRGSGVFAEARNIGIPIVATEGCAFARPAFDGGWGIGIADYGTDGLADAMIEALGRIGDLKARAAVAAAGTKDDLGSILQATVDAARAERPRGLTGAIRRLLRPAL